MNQKAAASSERISPGGRLRLPDQAFGYELSMNALHGPLRTRTPGQAMFLGELITPNAILPALRASGKRAALAEMSETAAALSGLPASAVLDAVLKRESLDSTGIGDGVAIPHGKLEGCGHIVGVFARLDKPVPFDSIDGAPVDMLFMLIASESAGADHLKALARVARLFRDQATSAKLRGTRDAYSLFAILTGSSPSTHAA